MVVLDKMTSLGHVMALAQVLSLYHYAELDGEVIPWPRVKLHDQGKFCHCYTCGPRCLICRANRRHPAHKYPDIVLSPNLPAAGPYMED